MIKATQRNTDSRKSRGNVIYSESFGKNGRTSFISGSAAPEDFWAERSQEEAHRRNTDIRIAARRSREQVMHMNRRYAFFMAFLVAAMTLSLIGYIKLMSDISSTNKRIATLESQLTELKSSNNEVYNELTGNVDLEEIRRIAIDEFGMKYADQDQIVLYSDSKGDSVRQIIDSDRW
jgi:cell division protein FtsL